MWKGRLLGVLLFSTPWVSNAQVSDVLDFAIGWYNNCFSETLQSTVESKVQDWAINSFMSDYLDDRPQAGEMEQFLVKEAFTSAITESFDWTNFVSGFAKVGSNMLIDYLENANFEEESAKLADFEYERPRLAETDRKYGLYDVATAYSDMPKTLTKTTNGIINAYSVKQISQMGDGAMVKYLDDKVDQSRNRCRIDDLQNVYSQAAVELINDRYAGLSSLLLDMARRDVRVALLINTNPELYLDYVNRACNTLIKGNTIQMVYWTETFNQKPNNWPAKVPFSQYSDLKFTGNTDVYANERLLANTSENQCIAKDLEMLNHKMIPMARTSFNGMTFTTDKLGRIVTISCRIEKGKCKDKTKYKAKNIVAEYNVEKAKPFFVVPKKCNGPECIANVIPVVSSPDNKFSMKMLKKNVKVGIKENLLMTASFSYLGSSSKMESISFKVGYEETVILKTNL